MEYSDSDYGGAPDECDIHWPKKLYNGFCMVEGCPNGKKEPYTIDELLEWMKLNNHI